MVKINLLAWRINHMVKSYYPYTEDTDLWGSWMILKKLIWRNNVSFSIIWIISRMLQKLEEGRATGLIILPLFTIQSQFSRLSRGFIENPLIMPKTNISLYFPDKRKEILAMLNVTLIAWLMSSSPKKQKPLISDLYKLAFWTKSHFIFG